MLSHPAVPHSKHLRLKVSLKPNSREQTQLLNLWWVPDVCTPTSPAATPCALETLSQGSLYNVTLTYAIFAHRVEGTGVLEQNSVQRTTSQTLQDLSAQPLRLTWLEHSRRKEEMETKPTSETVSSTRTHTAMRPSQPQA